MTLLKARCQSFFHRNVLYLAGSMDRISCCHVSNQWLCPRGRWATSTSKHTPPGSLRRTCRAGSSLRVWPRNQILRRSPRATSCQTSYPWTLWSSWPRSGKSQEIFIIPQGGKFCRNQRHIKRKLNTKEWSTQQCCRMCRPQQNTPSLWIIINIRSHQFFSIAWTPKYRSSTSKWHHNCMKAVPTKSMWHKQQRRWSGRILARMWLQNIFNFSLDPIWFIGTHILQRVLLTVQPPTTVFSQNCVCFCDWDSVMFGTHPAILMQLNLNRHSISSRDAT